MSDKLWFISESSDVIAVFDDRVVADEELFYLNENDPTGSFKVYGLTFIEIKDYADELNLAQSEGYFE